MRLAWLVLGAVPIKETHQTGDVICQKIHEHLAKMNIDKSKIHLVLRDDGSNMISAVEKLEVSSFQCFLHKINLVAETGEKALNIENRDLIEKVKTLIRKINKSSVQRNYLKILQEEMNLPVYTLKRVRAKKAYILLFHVNYNFRE